MADWFSYARFERITAGLLTIGMAIVIVFGLVHVGRGLYEIAFGAVPGWEYSDFQNMFDRVLAVIIALELSRSVQQTAAGKHGLAQVRTVVLIGVLAVVRKLIVLEIETTSGAFLAGLAAAILALGVVYTLILWMESRAETGAPDMPGRSG